MGLSRSRIDAGGANKALDNAAKEALYPYIEYADDLGIPVREKTLVKAANSILRNRHFGEGPSRVVSDRWPSRWLKKHSEFRKKYFKPLTIS
jgi:Tc5 transposase DNA-binding domain